MNVFEFLKNFFTKLFLEKPTSPTADKSHAGAEDAKRVPGGLETRCVNPDTGCPFEVS